MYVDVQSQQYMTNYLKWTSIIMQLMTDLGRQCQ